MRHQLYREIGRPIQICKALCRLAARAYIKGAEQGLDGTNETIGC